jgi:hypothetical protein
MRPCANQDLPIGLSIYCDTALITGPSSRDHSFQSRHSIGLSKAGSNGN